MKKRNIWFLSYYFPPTGGGGVQRIVKFIKYLDLSKFNISVITASQTGLAVSDSDLIKDIDNSVKIIRINHTPPHRWISIFRSDKDEIGRKNIFETSYLKRWLSALVFFPDSRKGWITEVTKYFNNHSVDDGEKPDIVIGSMPPYSSGILAKILAEKFNCPYILDYRDGWIYHPFQIFPTFVHKLMHRSMEKKVLSGATGLIFANESLHKRYRIDYPMLSQDSITIYNGYDDSDFATIEFQQEENHMDKLKIGLPGTIYFSATRPLTLLRVLKNANDKADIYKFYILGKITKSFLKKIQNPQLYHYFTLENYLSHSMYLKRIRNMDVNLLFLESDAANIQYVIPGRFYELFYSKIPLIIFGPEYHEINDLRKKYTLPFFYFNNTEDEVLRVLKNIRLMIRDLNNRINVFDFTNIEDLFSRKKQACKFQNFIEQIL